MNDSATVLERYHYTPYGEVTFLEPDFDPIVGNASAIGNNILYTGRERDPETGLQLNRYRILHPPLGRWLTWDPIRYDGGGYNLYEYVGGTPTESIDPFGLSSLLGCYASPAAMWACIQSGAFNLGQIAKPYYGNGAKLIKRLEKWGGQVVKGGKGSHTKIKMPWGRTETVPTKPGKGLVHDILKRCMENR